MTAAARGIQVKRVNHVVTMVWAWRGRQRCSRPPLKIP